MKQVCNPAPQTTCIVCRLQELGIHSSNAGNPEVSAAAPRSAQAAEGVPDDVAAQVHSWPIHYTNLLTSQI